MKRSAANEAPLQTEDTLRRTYNQRSRTTLRLSVKCINDYYLRTRATVHWMLTRGPQVQYLFMIYGPLSTGC